MKKIDFFFITLLFFILLVFSYSCSIRQPLLRPEIKVANYKEATLQELITMINERSRKIDTLIASIDIDFRPISERNFRSCKGRLMVEKPDQIRLKGYRSLLPTFFLLVSDGSTYWLSVPSKKRVYKGQVEERVVSEDLSQEDIYFTPSHIVDSLFLDEIKLDASQKAFLDILPDMYIINIVKTADDGVLFSRKRIWIDRKDFTIYKHEQFDLEGKLISEVSFRQFKEISGILFPGLIYIRRPWEGIDTRLLFNKITFNTSLDPEAFTFFPSKDQEIINLSKDEADKKRLMLY
jgi:outer membrane lipoprotein-sorting protein